MLTPALIRTTVARALEEDAPWGDISAELVVDSRAQLRTEMRAREGGVFAGGQVLREAFTQVDPRISVTELAADGKAFSAGAVLARVAGPARGILTAERTALNFCQRMSGIATETAHYVQAVAAIGSAARIADTRKTAPGLRAFDKHAVACGGGSNHRFGLSDAIMIKDNHLAALEGDTTAALRRVRARAGHTTAFIVEVDSLEQVPDVVAGGPTGILLDNFTLEDLRAAVELIAGRCVVEASGGVSLSTVGEIAATGVDIISVGALTHSVRALDLGLDAR
ncbi:carboxylating nicotinate-nucleotide diphosphorylase [Corynebacterium flavescens]|uniref:carboxylating nicotinate-nucleotide diphosphorylase n=1 Tax=Corynebacterium flavescens TaxID=28028 RepID=UPI003FD46247